MAFKMKGFDPGSNKKEYVPATAAEIAAAGKRTPPLAYAQSLSIQQGKHVWVKK